MNFKKIMPKYILITILVFIGITSIFFIPSLNLNKSSHKKPIFLLSKGDIFVPVKTEYPLSLIFIDSSKSDLFNSFNNLDNNYINISFDNPNIDISSFNIEKGDKYKGIALYSLNLNIKINNKNSNDISKVNINIDGKNTSYDIGKIIINSSNNSNKIFELLSNTSSGTNLGRYDFELKNISGNTVDKINISNGIFDEHLPKIECQINSNNTLNIEKLSNKDVLTTSIDFSKLSSDYIYYFSPRINYVEDNIEKIYFLPYALYGLPLDENKLETLSKEYSNQ